MSAGRGEGLAGLEIVDYADGTHGSYCIARTHSEKYTEYWNPDGWKAFGYVFKDKQLAEALIAALEAAAPAGTPDVFDFVGRKMATHLVETMGALEGFAEPFRAAGQSALEEFWFRATGKHIDWDSLAPEVRAEDLTAALATPSPQVPQEIPLDWSKSLNARDKYILDNYESVPMEELLRVLHKTQSNTFSPTSAREQSSATASDNLTVGDIAMWLDDNLANEEDAPFERRTELMEKAFRMVIEQAAEAGGIAAETYIENLDDGQVIRAERCAEKVEEAIHGLKLSVPAATQEQPAGSEATREASELKAATKEWAADILTSCAQILDVVKPEWGESWSAWDQTIRNDITRWLKSFYLQQSEKLAGSPRKVGEDGQPGPLMTAIGPMNLADFSRHLADDIYAISDGAAPDRETLRAMIRARLEVGLKYWKWERLAARSSSVPVGEQKQEEGV